MELPFDGAISRYFENDAPKAVRKAIKEAGEHDILSKGYAYRTEMPKADYERTMEALQVQLVRMQAGIRKTTRYRLTLLSQK